MKFLDARASRVAFACALSSAMAVAGIDPARAQIVVDDPLSNGGVIKLVTPVNDTDCPYSYGSYTSPTVPPCTVDGRRSVTVIDSSRSNYSPTLDIVTTTYKVNFDGNLALDGRPVAVASPAEPPFWPDITEYYSMTNMRQIIDVTGSYIGTNTQAVAIGAVTPAPVPKPAYLYATRDVNFTVNRIDASLAGYLETTDGGEYNFNYASQRPTTIINGNSVALTGSFNGTSAAGAIQFGTISGSATLLTTPQLTDYPDWAGGRNYALYSPFGLEYALTTAITTQLDETGLITPKIAVTNGIAMNGSKVTGLAAGTAATDAVNKAQLDGEAQARIAADLTLTRDIAAEAAARAQADTTLNQRIAREEAARAQVSADLQSESNARAAADLALGTKVSALGSRVDALNSRVERVEQQVDRLDRKIASSTAVAVAMSGNTFLPNTSFNLTANVATYDGAQAGAFQMGAMVTDNVAVNAGVATAFSKGGKAAGRVGFTVGW